MQETPDFFISIIKAASLVARQHKHIYKKKNMERFVFRPKTLKISLSIPVRNFCARCRVDNEEGDDVVTASDRFLSRALHHCQTAAALFSFQLGVVSKSRIKHTTRA